MTQQKDIYDLEVERLTRNPHLIHEAWAQKEPLFRMIGDEHSDNHNETGTCGCLTMIKEGVWQAWISGERNWHVENAIRADKNIPIDIDDDRTPSLLPHFAKWQRRIDRMNAGESFEDVMKEDAI